MKRPIITLLTDFGLTDYYVGAMKGVILGICPDAHIVDITHDIVPFQIVQGAWVLQQAWKSFPAGTIHLAVVDPGVGSERLPILAEAGGHLWIGPDNGVLSPSLVEAGGLVVRTITEKRYFLHPVSKTFHGRDIFAPVAAHLAFGVSPAGFGPVIPDVVALPPLGNYQTDEGVWMGHVVWVDRFGNLVTSFDAESFGWVAEVPFELAAGRKIVTQYAQYYGGFLTDVPTLTAGSSGRLEISINQQHAAMVLGMSPGDALRLSRG